MAAGFSEGPDELATRGRETVGIPGQNCASLVGFADKVEAVLEDQGRGQVLEFTEEARFPDLVFPSLGAQRKDKPNGVISARVLFNRTHGLAVNTRTRIRDQERSLIAADLKP